MSKLNLQEKRRIEDLIFSEISEARDNYRDQRRDACTVLQEKLSKNPPASALRLREDILKLESQVKAVSKQIEEKEEALQQTGYRLTKGEGRDLELNTYGIHRRKELLDFEDETDKKLQSIEQIKKRHILMVYSDSDEVKGLFDKVSEEIAKIVA